MYWSEWKEYKSTKGGIYHERGCKTKSYPSYAGWHLRPHDKFLVVSTRPCLVHFWPQTDERDRQCWATPFELLHAVLAQPPLHSLLQEVTSSKLTSKTHLNVTAKWCALLGHSISCTINTLHNFAVFWEDSFCFWYPACFNTSKRTFSLWKTGCKVKECIFVWVYESEDVVVWKQRLVWNFK